MIYKYNVGYITVPSDSRFLFAKYQNDNLMVWVELGKLTPVVFEVNYTGTGWEEDTSDKQYLNSVENDGYIWHVFYKQLKKL
mgnify:CR=1 FL=1